MTHKTCKRCGETKPLEGFYKDKKNKDGHRGICKTCDKAQVYAKRKGPKVSRTLSYLFDGYPEIFEQIKSMAKKEFRTPEQQILYLLSRALGEKDAV